MSTLPRTQWQDHPNFPVQTLLLDSHRNFIAINDYLVDRALRDPHPELLEGRYRRWIAAMRSHERYEETKLYPYLERRWGVDLGASKRGHDRLHEKHAQVLAAFQNAREPEDTDAARASLVHALSDHLATLTTHLRVEEDAVIPLLLDLERDEFTEYCAKSIDALLAGMPTRE